ncbi:hypothetical protein DYGSA30_02700 [Dyella sp. GSA-30]|nr:hypothetical protein DYGSA30_02700 [Dyella sp. GSA-30]
MDHQLRRLCRQGCRQIGRVHIDHRRAHGGIAELDAHRVERLERSPGKGQLEALIVRQLTCNTLAEYAGSADQ